MLNMILRCNPTNLNRANTHRQPWQELDRDTGVHGRRLFLPACHVRGPTRQRETSFPRTHRLLQLHPPALHTPAPMFTCPTQLPPHTSFFPFSPRNLTHNAQWHPGPTTSLAPPVIHLRCGPARARRIIFIFFCAGPTMLATGGAGAQAVPLPTATLHFTVGPTRTVSPPAPPLPRSGPTPTDVWAPLTSPGPLSASGCWGLSEVFYVAFVWGSGCWGALQIIFFLIFFGRPCPS